MNDFPFRFFGLMRFLAPILYIVGAVLVWLDFSRTNPDGLANLGLIVYTLPIAVPIAMVFGDVIESFPGGYLSTHALYSWPSVALLASSIFGLFHFLQNRFRPLDQGNYRQTSKAKTPHA